jgi:hypothetical protein
MPEILKIKTVGYVGPGTGFQYLPPGEHTVGDKLDLARRIVPAELAATLWRKVVEQTQPDGAIVQVDTLKEVAEKRIAA